MTDKPEPLSIKDFTKHKLWKECSCDDCKKFRKIISVVEWYLQETKKVNLENKLFDEWLASDSMLNYNVWLVLKAFEDVMKE